MRPFRTVMARASLAIVAVALAAGTHAATVVDRGLPDTNLNNAAGGDRSNVAWGFNGDFLSGDDFTLASTGDPSNPLWRIDKLSTWIVAGAADPDATLNDTFDSVFLYFGSASGPTAPLALSAGLSGNSTDNPNVAVSKVTYADGNDYQGSSGDFLNIFQVDFMNVGTVAPGDYVFSLGSDPMDGANPFMHASNAALSGTPQQGADDEYRWFRGAGGDPSIELGGFIDSDGNGWDKSSDINVQVSATAVPVPGAGVAGLAMIGGLGLLRRRRPNV